MLWLWRRGSELNERGNRVLKEIFAEAQRLGRYDVGETIEGLACKLGKAPSDILKLNSNENFFVPLDSLKSVLKEVAEETDPRIYPRDEPLKLKEALGRNMAVPPEEIVISAGSDPLIDLVSHMALRRGDEALSISPTFSIYERCVRLQGADYRTIPLREDFSIDVEKMLASATPRTKLLFLCSPNNPTANQFSRREIQRLAEGFDGLIAVDEAYVDFASFSLVDLVGNLKNLIVFRTFSKVFGLAGLRLGYAVTNRDLAKVMDEKFQLPYSFSLISLKTALKLLEKIKIIKCAVEESKAERSRLIEALNQIPGVHAFGSQTNFVLFQVRKNSGAICDALLKRGVIVRNIGQVLCFENCLRVTVAPPHMTDRFLVALRAVLGE